MATFNDMVDEVRQSLAGYANQQDKINYISNSGTAITASATSITLGDTTTLAKGVLEIDDELLYATAFNKNSGAVTIAPGFGRGYMDTTATTHADSSKVLVNPTFPRNAIKRAINDTILAVYPQIFGVNTYTFTYNSAVTSYSIPDEVEGILSIRWESIGPTKEWIPVRKWYQDSMANTTAFNSNNSVTINQPIVSGRTVQVTYSTQPNALSNPTDDFAITSGLPASVKDVIILGAAYRLASFVDVSRINSTTAEADMNDTKSPSGAGVNISKYLYALYKARLADESAKQVGRYPVRVHYTY
jgi:hypothetical protein